MNGMDARRILLWLLAAEVLLVALHGTVRATDGRVAWGALDPLLDLDRERSVGTWFSTAQLLAIAAVFTAAARAGPPAALSRALALPGLAFVFLAADEALQIHESLTARAAAREVEWLTALAFRGGHGTWVLPYAAAGLAACALALPAVREVWRRYRAEATIIAAGAGVMGAGAVGLEVASYQFLRDGAHPMLYTAEVAAEEFLEMAGASIVLYGAMGLARHRRAAAAPAARRAAPSTAAGGRPGRRRAAPCARTDPGAGRKDRARRRVPGPGLVAARTGRLSRSARCRSRSRRCARRCRRPPPCARRGRSR